MIQSPPITIKFLMRFSKFHLVSSCTNNIFSLWYYIFFFKASHWAEIRLEKRGFLGLCLYDTNFIIILLFSKEIWLKSVQSVIKNCLTRHNFSVKTVFFDFLAITVSNNNQNKSVIFETLT